MLFRSASSDSSGRLSEAVSQLSLKTGSSASKDTKAKRSKTKKAPVADSWEDESLSSESADETDQPSSSRDARGMRDVDVGTQAPPPTPISATYNNNAVGRPFSPTSATYPSSVSGADNSSSPSKRPEKTDAVARRMIAAGLGLKVPKQTEEQKAYDRAVREKERKRHQQEKEEKKKKEAELEKARQAIWDD